MTMIESGNYVYRISCLLKETEFGVGRGYSTIIPVDLDVTLAKDSAESNIPLLKRGSRMAHSNVFLGMVLESVRKMPSLYENLYIVSTSKRTSVSLNSL